MRTVILVTFIIFLVVHLAHFGWRRRLFGRELWSTPRLWSRVWMVGFLWLLILPELLYPNAPGELFKETLWMVMASLLVIDSVLAMHRLRIYEGGVSVGARAFAWNEVRGWASGPEGRWAGEPPSARLEPTGSGPSRLYLWTNSPWRVLHRLIPRRVLDTGVEWTAELEAVLREAAPGLAVQALAELDPAGQRLSGSR